MTGVIVKAAVEGWVFEAAPCEDCPNAALCRGGHACRAFESFIAHGGRRWAAEPREPSKRTYEQIFRFRA